MKSTKKMILIPFEKYHRVLIDPDRAEPHTTKQKVYVETQRNTIEQSTGSENTTNQKPLTNIKTLSSNTSPSRFEGDEKQIQEGHHTSPPPLPGIPIGNPISIHKVKPYNRKQIVKSNWKLLWKA